MTEDSLRYKVGNVVFATLEHKVTQFITMFVVMLMLPGFTWQFWLGAFALMLNSIGSYGQGWNRGNTSAKKLLLSILDEKIEEIKAKEAAAKTVKAAKK